MPNAPVELFFVVLLLLLLAGASPVEIAILFEELPEEAEAMGILEIVVHVPPLVVPHRVGRARRVILSQILPLPMAADISSWERLATRKAEWEFGTFTNDEYHVKNLYLCAIQ